MEQDRLSRQHGHRHRRQRRGDRLHCLAGQLPGGCLAATGKSPPNPALRLRPSAGEREAQVRASHGVVTGELATTFISGTASITASESRHHNSVERQTRQSLENIEALIGSDSFRCHGFGSRGATLDDLAVARVYVKRPEDYGPVRAICRARLGDLPTIYVVGDICRPELLVEVEGVALCPS